MASILVTGHTVYAGMRRADTRPEAAQARAYGMHPVDLDVRAEFLNRIGLSNLLHPAA